ncbi:MAG: AAA family ATPase [Planctomycetota bacterium]
MDPRHNPYVPSAGSPPAELAGREMLIEAVDVVLHRVLAGRSTKSHMLIGLRGVGKTVLLAEFRKLAEGIQAQGRPLQTVRIEAPEKKSLPAMLLPDLRRVLLKLSLSERSKELAKRGLRALASFAKLKTKYDDIVIELDLAPELGLADSGDLETDLIDVIEITGMAAQKAGGGVAMFIDELQYVEENQLAALITALHRCSQSQLPVVLFGAGLPQLRGQMGKAKSYAERLFEFAEITELNRADARRAITKPAEEERVVFEDAALDEIVRATQGYPYFLQEWGKHAWDTADASPITLADVTNATKIAIAELDKSFFSVRFDRLTPSEKVYLRAMAELGPGPHRSGDIAELLGKTSQTVAPTRARLIEKGMAYSPGHGDTAFTVPLFDEFMKRTMPGEEWRAG